MRNPRAFDPFAFWSLSVEIGQMALEAQTVIALRTLGMAGVLPMNKDEPARMVREKQAALTSSGIAAGRAMLAGKNATDIMAAAVKPMRAKTRANSRRLTKGKT